MTSLLVALCCTAMIAAVPAPQLSAPRFGRPPRDERAALVERYLTDLQRADYQAAYALLTAAARTYYRDAANLESVYAADRFRIEKFALLGARDGRAGEVVYIRETAHFRDHAHDVDLNVTATVPIGVVRDGGRLSIKDPGHPWRAFQSDASATANGLRVIVKKMSFFARRVEAVVTFVNAGPAFVTALPYDKSVLRDTAGQAYRIVETRDWSLTDKTLFEGLRLAPGSQYTGTLAFRCGPRNTVPRAFALTVGPLLVDGAQTPFAMDINGISAMAPADSPVR